MSVRLIRWAFEQECPTPSAKLVLVALADEVRGKAGDTCWPSRKLLAQKSSLSLEQVRKNLRLLEDAGLIASSPRTTKAGRRTSSLYTLLATVENRVENQGVPLLGVGVPPLVEEGVTTLNQKKEPEQLTISSLRSSIGAGGPIGEELEPEQQDSRAVRWLFHLQRKHGRLGRKVPGSEASADASVIRSLVRQGCEIGELAFAIQGTRLAADRGELRGFVEKGKPFGARVLKAERNGRPLWLWAADRWRKEEGVPKQLGDVLRQVMRPGPSTERPARTRDGGR